MPKEMTSERAIIILDNLNTDGRIEVDRDELRAAVAVAKTALRKQVKMKPIPFESIEIGKGFGCPCCESLMSEDAENRYCDWCGQALMVKQ